MVERLPCKQGVAGSSPASGFMIRLLAILVLCLGGCFDRKEDPRSEHLYHVASAWVVTPGGITRDAGPFGSVASGYTTDGDIDAALDSAMEDFYRRFPAFTWVNPLVHLTDSYSFFVPGSGFASGYHMGDNQVAVALWTRVETTGDPGNYWIVRPPGEYYGVYYPVWRSTQFPLVPAYQHECLHVAIGDPGHTSPLWALLK